MRFGTVSGVLGIGENERWFTVMLQTRDETVVVRDDVVPAMLEGEDSAWVIDQLVQETLGIELALEGWEVVAVSERAPDNFMQSRTYTVRNLS
ncbi:MAG: hypothetical protein M9953_13625 [Thermomicrobiales bacterium]|nr:hypothetical protein [Thermomicrobiales bacterium]MCO5219894.1 hypothetical protein [Thermomicrobiales bacterium]MCO5226373.1 hypothetical protein [Thermomicrobiales bacterium]MCO5228934.1 hypothetical protein [Thermomicrobiales bacterium]